MKPAKQRYSIVQAFTCPRCGASDGAQCDQAGKARRTPHRDRVTKAYASPGAHRAMVSEAKAIAAPYQPRRARQAPQAARIPTNPVQAMMATIAEAFSGR